MTKPRETSSWATLIGGGYAYVQHGMDKVIEWGFGQMEKVAEEPKDTPKKTEAENEHIAQAKRLAKKAALFVGQTGNAYYETYRTLKKEEKK